MRRLWHLGTDEARAAAEVGLPGRLLPSDRERRSRIDESRHRIIGGLIGTSVDIRGSSFTGATSVKFNGTAGSLYRRFGYRDPRDRAQRSTTGPISVTTPNGTGTSSSTFSVVLDTPPIAGFTFSCSALTCSFDGSGSADSDGTIDAYSWDFGDNATGSGQRVSHTFSRAGNYTVTLVVAENGGATARDSKTIAPISLSARGNKQGGLQKVDLWWSGRSGVSFDVQRNGLTIASVQASSYTDTVKKSRGTYTHKVCAPATSTCSNDASVSF
jgi:hypothetical protein